MVEAKRVMSGTFGELWLDNDYVAEATKSQAKVEFNKEEIKMCG
ncbi:MAG: phage portal protein, partial [Butyrivibrio sp.]|nr:phage portal protein [Butyrivibrio sp.]